MSDDKLNEVGNDNLDKDAKLITDSPSEPLERTDGPKRRTKEPRKIVEEVEDLNDTEKVFEELIETVKEENEAIVVEKEIVIEEVEEPIMEEEIVVEEMEIPKELADNGIEELIKIEPSVVVEEQVLATGVVQGNPVVTKEETGKKKKKKKANKVAMNVAFEETKVNNSKKEEHVVSEQNEESKAPKTMKDRYIKMLDGKGFEVRLKGNRIFNSPIGNTDFSLGFNGIILNGKHYKYSDVVIRIKN